MKNFLLCFAAGCVGGVIYCVVMWLFSRYGISQSFGVSLYGSLPCGWPGNMKKAPVKGLG